MLISDVWLSVASLLLCCIVASVLEQAATGSHALHPNIPPPFHSSESNRVFNRRHKPSHATQGHCHRHSKPRQRSVMQRRAASGMLRSAPSKPLCRVSLKFQGRRSATELFTVSRSSSALLPLSCTALLSLLLLLHCHAMLCARGVPLDLCAGQAHSTVRHSK